MKYEKKLTEMSDDKDNFYSIIEIARDLIKDNDWWQLEEQELKNQAQMDIDK